MSRASFRSRCPAGSKKTRKFGGCALARHYGVDQSYIHRIIAGEERPCEPV